MFEFREENWAIGAEIGQKKVSRAGEGDDAEFLQSGGEGFSCALDLADVSADGFAFTQRGLGRDQRGNVYGEWRHSAADVSEGILCGDHRAEAKSCEACGFGKSPGDEEIRVAANPRDGGEAGKLRVGFVENDNGVGSGVQYFSESGGPNKSSCWIVGIGQEKDARLFAERREDVVEWKALPRVVAANFDARARDFRVIAVHREGWLADEDVRTRLDESVKENAQCIIAAVG